MFSHSILNIHFSNVSKTPESRKRNKNEAIKYGEFVHYVFLAIQNYHAMSIIWTQIGRLKNSRHKQQGI